MAIAAVAIINGKHKTMPIATARNQNSVVSNQRRDIYLNGAPENFYGIKEERAQSRNPIGCLEIKPNDRSPDGTLCLKSYGMELIAEHGGNFQSPQPFYVANNGATRRCAGSGYFGWREFGTMLDAINYLRQYFNVRACDEKTKNRLVRHGVLDVTL